MTGRTRFAFSLALLCGLGWGLRGASTAAARHPEAKLQSAAEETRGLDGPHGDHSLAVLSPVNPPEDQKPDDLKGLPVPSPKKPEPEISQFQQKKTDLLAHRRRSRAPDDHSEAPLSVLDDTDGDGLPPHKGAEELFVGGMLMAISGALKMQNVRGQAGLFLVLVFAIVGVMCAVMGALHQFLSYRKRKKWISNQGSLLDHLKD